MNPESVIPDSFLKDEEQREKGLMEKVLEEEELKYVVTGGAGFIGSNVVNSLLEDGHDVVVIDNCYLGDWENIDRSKMRRAGQEVTLIEESVVDGLSEEMFEDAEAVFHFAALSSLTMHQDDPQEGCRVNVEGFVNVMEYARRAGVEDVVYATTSSIYSDAPKPSPSAVSVSATTGYEASKLARERYAEHYQSEHGMNVCGLRYFSVYQGFDGNEEHKGEYGNVISQFAEKMRQGESPVIFGDGTQTRDFTHVRDIVRATLDAVGESGVYNAGTGRSVTFNELVEMLNDELGTDIEPEYIDNPIDPKIYVHETLADCTRFHEATGWEPEISLEEGLSRVV